MVSTDSNTQIQSFTLKELSQYFHLPINEAAEKLGVCATVLKKVSRNNGVKRWPYRKIKSLNNMIDSLQALIDAKDGDLPALNMDMNDLIEKRNFLMANPNTNYKFVVSKYAINAFNTKIQRAIDPDSQEIPKSSKASVLKPKLDIPGPTKTIKKPSQDQDHIKSMEYNKLNIPQYSSYDPATDEAARTLAKLKSTFANYVIPADTSKKPCTSDFFKEIKYQRIPTVATHNPSLPMHLFPGLNRPLRMSG